MTTSAERIESIRIERVCPLCRYRPRGNIRRHHWATLFKEPTPKPHYYATATCSNCGHGWTVQVRKDEWNHFYEEQA